MDYPSFSLDGKVAVVTGASRGIGEAIALAFANAGADVVVSSRKLPDLEKVAEEIKGLGRRALPLSAHVGKREEWENLVKAVMTEFGRIDILVNNAATNPAWADLLGTEEWTWDAIMNVIAKGPFFLTQMVGKTMKEQGGGNIINITSIEGFRVGDRAAIYDMAKAAMIHFTNIAAVEWAPYNIRVNTVAPGFVKTRLVHSMWENPEYLAMVEEKIPVGRAGEPMDIAGAAVFLASDASRWVTGSMIVVDGGLHLRI